MCSCVFLFLKELITEQRCLFSFESESILSMCLFGLEEYGSSHICK